MNTEKINEVFSDEAFVRSLLEMQTAGEVQTALKEKGIELTEEEIFSIHELVSKIESGEITKEQLEAWQKQAEDGELSAEALEQVVGGSITLFLIGTGTVIGASVGLLAWKVDEMVQDTTGRHW